MNGPLEVKRELVGWTVEIKQKVIMTEHMTNRPYLFAPGQVYEITGRVSGYGYMVKYHNGDEVFLPLRYIKVPKKPRT